MSESTACWSRRPLAWVWSSALLLFVVAGLTGVLFRFGMAYGWTGGLGLGNVRHAHSHLMYFGWGTPALMALIWRLLPDRVTTPRRRHFRWVVGCTLAAAAIAYPPFLLYGYSPVQIGAAHLPIAVVGASLNMLAWYGFVALYVAATRRLTRTSALRLWDLAVLALVLSTMGAWGLALLQPLGLHNPMVATALTHVFLDLFSEGWFVLGGLGVGFSVLETDQRDPSEWPIWLVGLGLPLTFLLALPQSSLSVGMEWGEWGGRLGGVLVAVCVLVLTVQLERRVSRQAHPWIWESPLAFLALKAAAQLGGSVVPGLWLGGHHGLRILYLHLMLLGFVSLGLVAGAQQVWRASRLRDVGLFQGAVAAVVGSLVFLLPWGGDGARVFVVAAAWVSGLPVVAALLLLFGRTNTARGVRKAAADASAERSSRTE